ncbi:MAG: 50S ribosomal protein L31e [Nanoarchaeota archaeon]|nr:50S ribosomal protein L31e [Nanoarchaeota archaeon]
MAEKTTTQSKTEREYIIPLRSEWRKVANYRRTGRAVKTIKSFIARHMKIPERDVSKVKLDQYLNQEVWFRGRKKPPAKIKVKAVKEGDIVRVSLAELPEVHAFHKSKHVKRHMPSTTTKAPAASTEEKKEEKTDEEKKEEKEKAQAAADVKQMEAKTQAHAQQKATAIKEPGHHRMALKK